MSLPFVCLVTSLHVSQDIKNEADCNSEAVSAGACSGGLGAQSNTRGSSADRKSAVDHPADRSPLQAAAVSVVKVRRVQVTRECDGAPNPAAGLLQGGSLPVLPCL